MYKELNIIIYYITEFLLVRVWSMKSNFASNADLFCTSCPS